MQQENHPDSNSYLDCEKCKLMMGEKVRATWNCGLLSIEKRKGPGFPVPANWGSDSDICPGYLITLPTVIEAARARMHWEKGVLAERYEDQKLTGILFDSIEVLTGALGELELRIATEVHRGNS
jgi:hypothetical protein